MRNTRIVKSCLSFKQSLNDGGLGERGSVKLTLACAVCPSLETVHVDFGNIYLVPHLLEVVDRFLDKALILNVGNVKGGREGTLLLKSVNGNAVFDLRGSAKAIGSACNVVVKGGVHQAIYLDGVYALPVVVIAAGNVSERAELVSLVKLGAEFFKKINRHIILPPCPTEPVLTCQSFQSASKNVSFSPELSVA